jgi:hypothetical protein
MPRKPTIPFRGALLLTNIFSAYPDYLEFFSLRISKEGVPAVLDRYVFSPEANGNGSMMLFRFVAGLLHPIIQAGVCPLIFTSGRVTDNFFQFGIEFGQDFMVAQGNLFLPKLFHGSDHMF